MQSPIDHVRVRAGPGSGKTRVLVHRIAHLLQAEDIAAREILAVTFTRKAAVEMKQRIGALVGESVLRKLTVCTLHSFCCMALRIAAGDDSARDGDGGNGNKLDRSFSIYDGDDSRRLVKDIMQSMGGIDPDLFSPAKVQEVISLLKREGRTSGGGGAQPANLDPALLGVTLDVLAQYTAVMRYSNARDFDDLVCDTLDLLRSSSATAIRLKSRFKHVLVDEFQDIDKSQYALLAELVPPDGGRKVPTVSGALRIEKTLFAVGDPLQTIYSWRGSDPLNMQKFEAHYASCARHNLGKNYRSARGIVDAAARIMALAPAAEDKGASQTQTQADAALAAPTGPPEDPEAVRVVNTFKDESQADFVAHMAAFMLHAREASSPSSLAILYRRHSLSPPIESAFIRRGLAYSIHGGPGLMGRKNVKDLCAYLRLLVNPRDSEALRRTINYPPRGVGKACEDMFFNTYGADTSPGGMSTPLLDVLIGLGAGTMPAEEGAAEGTLKTKKKKTRPSKMEKNDDFLAASALTPRQIKALGGAGKVFASLRQLLTTWTGSLEALLLEVLTLSGLKERAVAAAASSEDALAMSRRQGGKRQATVAGTKELDQLLSLAREYERGLPADEPEDSLLEDTDGEEGEGGAERGQVDGALTSTIQLMRTSRLLQSFLDMLQLCSAEEEGAGEGGEGGEGAKAAPSVGADGKIKLMTLHAAKGLEFDCVMIIGVEENCLPALGGGVFGRGRDESKRQAAKANRNDESNPMADDSDADAGLPALAVTTTTTTTEEAEETERAFIEEERRLLYVGMTRARRKLLLLYRSRMSLGGGGNRLIPVKPSRFLRNLEGGDSVSWLRAGS